MNGLYLMSSTSTTHASKFYNQRLHRKLRKRLGDSLKKSPHLQSSFYQFSFVFQHTEILLCHTILMPHYGLQFLMVKCNRHCPIFILTCLSLWHLILLTQLHSETVFCGGLLSFLFSTFLACFPPFLKFPLQSLVPVLLLPVRILAFNGFLSIALFFS